MMRDASLFLVVESYKFVLHDVVLLLKNGSLSLEEMSVLGVIGDGPYLFAPVWPILPENISFPKCHLRRKSSIESRI